MRIVGGHMYGDLELDTRSVGRRSIVSRIWRCEGGRSDQGSKHEKFADRVHVDCRNEDVVRRGIVEVRRPRSVATSLSTALTQCCRLP